MINMNQKAFFKISEKDKQNLSNSNNFGSRMFCGFYYKHVTIVNDDSSVINKWSFKLIDDPRVVTYDRHKFIIQATEVRIYY